jgi:hypothetical protein
VDTTSYNRWDRGLPGGTPGTTTIIICTTWCARRYISRVRSFRVLIFMYWAKVSSWYYDGRSCSICTRCFHRCSARIPTITAIVVCIPIKPPLTLSHLGGYCMIYSYDLGHITRVCFLISQKCVCFHNPSHISSRWGRPHSCGVILGI